MYLQPTQSWVDDILWTEDWRCLDRMSGQPDSAEGCREEVGYKCTSTKGENKTKSSLAEYSNKCTLLSSLSSLHSFVLLLVHCWTLSIKFPSNHSKQIILTKNQTKEQTWTTFFGCCCINSEYPSNAQLHKNHCKITPWKCFRNTWSHTLFWSLWYVGYWLLVPFLS